MYNNGLISIQKVMILCILLAISREGMAARAIPDDNLAYPVLITLENGQTGSGFFLNTESATFLVTARHVLLNERSHDPLASSAEILSYGRDPQDKGRNRFRLDLRSLNKAGHIKAHDTHDVVVVRVGIPSRKDELLAVVGGVKVEEIASSGILGVGESTIKRFREVLTANQVFIFGYPTSLGLERIPQIDYSRPLLRSGIVAGVNDKLRTIILDCPTYPGNSGGPVVEVEAQTFERRFRVIGVVSQFIPASDIWYNVRHKYHNINLSNSGYTVAIPMDFVLELIGQY